jgi:hypothetical protein
MNGEKMWITNGGFADVFIIFAQVEGDKFSAFIVERAFGGVTSGKEEHKMGLHGSSTTAVILQDVKVPAENLLGEIGKGHKIAFNVLNFARLKLGAMCAGAARGAIGAPIRLAQEFRTADCVVRGDQTQARRDGGAHLRHRKPDLPDRGHDRRASRRHRRTRPALRSPDDIEYAIEASIAKVAGSEMLNFVLDENIQIHGGNGFVRDYPAERHYRDSRVIDLEGTNEINRLLIRACSRGAPPKATFRSSRPPRRYGELLDLGHRPPRAVLGGKARRRRIQEGGAHGLRRRPADVRPEVGDQQEVLIHLADILMDVYAADSAVLGRPLRPMPPRRASLHIDAARVFVNDADAHRRFSAPGARRDGRGRYVADHARGAAAALQDDADQPAALRRRLRTDRLARRISVQQVACQQPEVRVKT